MGAIVPFNGSPVPAHIAARFGGQSMNDDLSSGVLASFPIISLKGKVWHVAQGDTNTLIADENGDPRPSIEVVIIRANPRVSKTYYPGGYEEGSADRPTCFSHDGSTPAPDAAEPQSAKCALCKWNQFGSKVTDNGSKSKACGDFRRLAVAPSADMKKAMLLRVPAASLRELKDYADMLNKRGAPYQAVVTRLGFDHTVAYPKLTFKATRWLTEEEAEAIAELVDSDVVQQVIGVTPETAAPAPVEDDIAGTPPATLAPKAAATAAPRKPKVTENDVAAAFGDAGDGGEEEGQQTPATPKPTRTARTTKPAAAAAPKPTAPAPKPNTQALVAEADASLDSILAQFEDDPVGED